MAIYVGTQEILAGKLKLGGNDIQEVYVGSQKVWPPAPPDVHYATIVSNGSMYISVVDVEGVYVIVNDTVRTDVPNGSTQLTIAVNGTAKVYIPGNIVPTTTDQIVAFYETNKAPSIQSLTIHNFGNLISLYQLARECGNLSTIIIEDKRPTIQSITTAFYETNISDVIDMNYEGVLYAQSTYVGTPLSSNINLELPNAINLSFMFDMYSSSASFGDISIIALKATNWWKTFNGIPATHAHVEMGAGVADSTKEMFRYAEDLECITGVLDTTQCSDTSSMFAMANNLISPNADEQNAIEGRARWENDACDVPLYETIAFRFTLASGNNSDTTCVEVIEVNNGVMIYNEDTGEQFLVNGDGLSLVPIGVSGNFSVRLKSGSDTSDRSRIRFPVFTGQNPDAEPSIGSLGIEDPGYLNKLDYLLYGQRLFTTGLSGAFNIKEVIDTYAHAFDGTAISEIPFNIFKPDPVQRSECEFIYAFANTPNLQDVDLPVIHGWNLTGMFYNSGVSTVLNVIPDLRIGDYSVMSEIFANCSNLDSVENIEAVSELADSMFYGCTQLVCINGHFDLLTYGSNMFTNCNNLVRPSASEILDIEAGEDVVISSCSPPTPEPLIPQMTGYTTGNVTVSASNEYPDAALAAWKAFDRDNNTRWSTEFNVTTAHLQIEFSDGNKDIYTITVRASASADCGPTMITLQESSDGNTWRSVQQFTGMTWTPGQYRELTVTQPTSYSKFRLQMQAQVCGSANLGLAEVQFIGF